MRRADRLFQIVQYLRNRRLTTAKWLADRLEVSDRTIYRDIQDLMLSGVPIEGEAGVGYMLRHGFDIPPLMFTEDELEALVIAARLAKTWVGGQLARSTELALDKIEAVLPEKLKSQMTKPKLFSPEILADQHTAAKLDDIRYAINHKRIIHIDYLSLQNDSSRRCVRSLGLFYWGKVWTLAAWCEDKHDFRSFRVDRISTLRVAETTFVETEETSLTRFLDKCYSEVDDKMFV